MGIFGGRLGIEGIDGAVRYTTFENGTADIVERVLVRYYGSADRAAALIGLGALEQLHPRLAPDSGEAHHFDSPAPNVTIALHRDRGDALVGPSIAADRSTYAVGRKVYLFVESEARWFRFHLPDRWEPVPARAAPPRGARVYTTPDALERLRRDLLEANIQVERTDSADELYIPSLAAPAMDKQHQLRALWVAAHAAASGCRVEFYAATLAGAVHLLGDAVVVPGSDELDPHAHARLVSRFEEVFPNEHHALALESVVQARARQHLLLDPSQYTFTTPPGTFRSDHGGHNTLRMAVKVRPSAGAVRVDFVVRRQDGVPIAAQSQTIVPEEMSPISCNVALPRELDHVTSSIAVTWFRPVACVSSPAVTFQADAAVGSDSADECQGITLNSWSLGPVPGSDIRLSFNSVHVRAVACFTPRDPGLYAMRIAVRWRSTLLQEDWVLVGHCDANQAYAADLMWALAAPKAEEMFTVDVIRVEPFAKQHRTFEHSRAD